MIDWRGRGTLTAATAIVLGCLGVGFRAWLTAADAPPTNSDEATFGLAALHILQGKDFPAFLYGQHYMGTLESYVAAPVIWLNGPTTSALRVGPLAFYALFLIAMYFLTRRLFSARGLALLVIGLLALGSDRVVKDRIIADGSAELAAITASLILVTSILAARRGRRRLLLFGAWGFLAGLSLWDHLLILPYLACGAVALALTCARELRGKYGLVALAGLLLGASPMIAHNLMSPFRNNSLMVLLHHNTAGSDAPLVDRLHGGVMLGIPLATGLCDPSHCSRWQMLWGPAYLALLVISAIVAVRAYRSGSSPDRARELGVLTLSLGGMITVVSYARSPAAADTPIESARYLELLLVSLPAAIWPLWRLGSAKLRVAGRTLAVASVTTLVVMMTHATAALAQHALSYADQASEQRDLLAAIDRLGITRFYTEYWTCNRLIYAADERVICAVLRDDLQPGLNRYTPYLDLVNRAEDVAYIAPAGSTFDLTISRYLSDSEPQVVEAAGYRLYLPGRPTHPPRFLS
ncbi:hypothetical protein [Micromonospora eburnea]|uniref:4-amino-4-deoxy-L-arabinose transferase n=1 Tax=Micromonospora eburnea TaxID=227316 RepID=A0A1C6TRS1_9ACTN|nr:hypothetical protein [Micromonospora eburnea]SCL44369.1 hypothetical protein GA0070604_0354 [Micromonospora eburnea]